MADTKISNLLEEQAPRGYDLLVTVDDPSGSPANKKITVGDANNQAKIIRDDLTNSWAAPIAENYLYTSLDSGGKAFICASDVIVKVNAPVGDTITYGISKDGESWTEDLDPDNAYLSISDADAGANVWYVRITSAIGEYSSKASFQCIVQQEVA